jgi:xanthine dehydrogenase iron-sulfur cluster and FAD-binding subunit A
VPRTAHAFRKVGTRRAQAISKVCFAGTARVSDGVVDDLRVAFGSVAPTVIRARHAEGAIRGSSLTEDRIGRAVTQLARDIAPIDDIRSTARYRATVASNLLKEFLHSLCA